MDLTEKGRVPIAFEGERMREPDNRLIVLGALTWPEDGAVPVLDMDGHVVGIADRLKRDRDGTISAVIRVEANTETAGLAPELDTILKKHAEAEDGRLLVEEASIYALTLGDRPCWDDMELE